ncbi:hypothetical protein Q4595_14625 [Wenyingzhuangia sp. 1_MG-2023]|nr:hypothetical protein [Wenyingzhuangia sp. 1_MG-2023]
MMLKNTSILEDTLLTCCPPAPELLLALKLNSLINVCRSINKLGVYSSFYRASKIDDEK